MVRLTADQDPRVFWDKVLVGNGCWEWQAALDRKGYGFLRYRGTVHRAHRVAWELVHGGQLTPDICVLHRCDNPCCVRPDHLFLGTQRDNIRDARDKGRLRPWLRGATHCVHGHPFDETNTFIRKNGSRTCRTCQAACARRYRDRKRAA